MNEKIVLSNLNERELSRSAALLGVGSFNTHFFGVIELAKEALLRSGIIIDKEIIDVDRQELIIHKLMKNINYFNEGSFIDAKNIVTALTYARELCRGNEDIKIYDSLKDGEFNNKNDALINIYNAYKENLRKENLIDGIDIINLAIQKTKPLDSEFIILEESPLTPLAEELLKHLSNNNYEIKTIRSLFNHQNKIYSDITYDKAYGGVNEIEHILGYIAKNDIKYDECVICVADESYYNHLLNYQELYDLPMTFGVGKNIKNSNAFKLLNQLDEWNRSYNGTYALDILVNSDSFNDELFFKNVCPFSLNYKKRKEIINVVGNLRLCVESPIELLNNYKQSQDKHDEMPTIIENIYKELKKGYGHLIRTYTNITSPIDEEAVQRISNYIYLYNKFENKVDLCDIINHFINAKILPELSKPGSIHITNLKGALSTYRKHLFICGLNSQNFPGSPSENYLLLDSDLEHFNEKNVLDSNMLVLRNKELIFNILDNASAFNSKIHISYTDYILSDIKTENPSSVLFEIFKKEYGDNVDVKKMNEVIGEQHKYFEEDISLIRNVARNYMKGIEIDPIKCGDISTYSVVYDKEISPSAAETFFECPKHFYLKHILGINEPDDDKTFEEMPANDQGTIIHECMEDYGNNPYMSKDEFLENVNKKIENYFNSHNPVHDKNINNLKKSLINMTINAYDNDPHNEVVESEKKLGPYLDPITGLKFSGRVDRIEKLKNGNYKIVDYKTGTSIKHRDDDVDTCFQVALYGLIFEECEKVKVEAGEYRYLRGKQDVIFNFNDENKAALSLKLQKIKEALDTGVFDYPEKDKRNDACRYCKLKDICGVNNLDEEDDDE